MLTNLDDTSFLIFAETERDNSCIIYTIILLTVSVSPSLSVLLIWGLYRPSSEPIALRNVLKCPTRHTLQTIRFWHFSSAALIVKKLKNAVLRQFAFSR